MNLQVGLWVRVAGPASCTDSLGSLAEALSCLVEPVAHAECIAHCLVWAWRKNMGAIGKLVFLRKLSALWRSAQ